MKEKRYRNDIVLVQYSKTKIIESTISSTYCLLTSNESLSTNSSNGNNPRLEMNIIRMHDHQIISKVSRKLPELGLAKLTLDPNNTPAWEVLELNLKPATKMSLFVDDHCISSTRPKMSLFVDDHCISSTRPKTDVKFCN
ncbi:hypothetical protein PGB90_001035 [Kerria lacca]